MSELILDSYSKTDRWVRAATLAAIFALAAVMLGLGIALDSPGLKRPVELPRSELDNATNLSVTE